MLAAVVLSLLVLASGVFSAWSWKQLRALEQRGGGKTVFRAWPVALISAVPVLLTAALLTWKHALAGTAALDFFIAYSAVAYPLLLWIGYVLMRMAQQSSRRRPPH